MVLKEILNLTTPGIGSPNEIHDLATTFNYLSKSKRKLIPDFYDCGTTARAIFLHLIKLHRGSLTLKENEISRIQEQYKACSTSTNSNNNEYNLHLAIQTLKQMNPGVMILSLAFWMNSSGDNQSGHVWIIEKVNKNKFHIYQSALDRYLVCDFYQQFGNIIDANLLLNNLQPFLQTKKWTPRFSQLFTEIFKFTPNIPYKTAVTPKFFWTYVEY